MTETRLATCDAKLFEIGQEIVFLPTVRRRPAWFWLILWVLTLGRVRRTRLARPEEIPPSGRMTITGIDQTAITVRGSEP